MLRQRNRRDFGGRFITPSQNGRVGTAFPREGPFGPIAEPQRTDLAEASTEDLMRVFRGKPDWKAMADAANVLGRRVDRLADLEALGAIARFCEDKYARTTAMEKLALRIGEIRDSRVLEAIVMNSEDDRAQRRAIDALGRRPDSATSSFTLVHIALRARESGARAAATTMLQGNHDSLGVVAQYSEYPDTRDYAQGLLGKNG